MEEKVISSDENIKTLIAHLENKIEKLSIAFKDRLVALER